MSMGSKLALALVVGAAALTMAPEKAEAGTVVASSGPSAGTYPVGAQIGDTQRITLRQGDSITVLDGGSTRVLRGPGTFILAQRSASAGNTALAALTARRGGSRARTGAVRGVEGANPVSNPNVWYVDVANSGTVCLDSGNSLRLWRADTSEEATYLIAPAGMSDDGVMVTFPANEMLALWDSALQLRDGHAYTISHMPMADDSDAMAEEAEPTRVTFALLEDAPSDPEMLAQALISRGCTIQLQQLVAAAETES